MTAVALALPGPLAVIPSPKAVAQLGNAPMEFVNELAQLAAAGTLPVRVEPDRRRLVVYTRRPVAWLYLTGLGDAYRIGHLSPRTFRDDGQLLTAALLLTCPGWRSYHDVYDLAADKSPFRRPVSGYWDELCRAWSAMAPPSAAPSHLPAQHEDYLDLLTMVVEASRDIETARQAAARPMEYSHRGPVREQRYSARGVYAFRLARPATVTPGSMVYLGDQPDVRGRVVEVTGAAVTIRFETPVDYRRIQPQGALHLLPSDRVFQAQLAAIKIMRDGAAAAPHLLRNLVDGHFAGYRPDTTVRPGRTLDADQLAAFRCALSVPDLLLILGPPGTGKTTTIVEIAAACAAQARQQRVLITSHTNRAVDNVLENLPPSVRAVRVGSEDAMTTTARSFMVETYSQRVRQDVLTATERASAEFAAFSQDRELIDRWLAHFAGTVEALSSATARTRDAESAVEQAVGRIDTPLRIQFGQAETDLARRRAAVRAAERDLTRTRDRLARSRARSGSGPFAFVFRLTASRQQRRMESVRGGLPGLRGAVTRASAYRDDCWAQLTTVAAADPEVARLTAALQSAQAAQRDTLAEVHTSGSLIRSRLQPLIAVPGQDPGDAAGWTAFHGWAARSVLILAERAALLSEWRAGIADAEPALQRELVRYADVVAATCIGTATSALLKDLEFGLAIVDEAGQIAMPNLLVPLVRARRAVLVGDHHQLPPYLDEDVRQWAEGLAGTESGRDLPAESIRRVGELLRDSGFERLYPSAGRPNRIVLTLQRRMPKVVAQFVSDAFYQGVLRTDHPGGALDPVFRSPFAMIDTADRTEHERFETAATGTEAWHQRGYLNELEAALITKLICGYAGRYQTWAVIVPYRAQVSLIAARLAAALPGSGSVADNVGTVDSFQGGQRDLIVYGFTRSNSHGEIGFLKERRRVNVAISRARQQLVVVGDTATLKAAKDREFAALIRSMTTYVSSQGDLRGSTDVERALGRLTVQRP